MERSVETEGFFDGFFVLTKRHSNDSGMFEEKE